LGFPGSIFSCDHSGLAAHNHWIPFASLGYVSFLPEEYESNLACAADATHYDRSVSLLTKPTLSGWKRFHLAGAALFLGSLGALVLTAIAVVAADLMIRREESQLEQDFAEEWLRYKSHVRRWL
jgi:hypothetical protein